MPVTVIIAAAAVAAALPIMVWSVSSARGPRHATVANLTRGLDGADLRDLVLARSGQERVVSPMMGSLAGLGRRLTPASAMRSLRKKVALAGQPEAWPLERVLAFKLVLGVASALVGMARFLASPGPRMLLLATAFTVAGFMLPDVMLRSRANRRQRQIRTALPDTLDQLTVCVEAGLAFESALARTAQNGTGALAEELTRTLQETRVGATRSEALSGLVERTHVPELRRFVTALNQAEVHGIPIARVLRTQSRDLRIRRRQRAEEHAHKIPIKLIFPLVTCILPSLVIVILGPAAIRMMRFFTEGALP